MQLSAPTSSVLPLPSSPVAAGELTPAVGDTFAEFSALFSQLAPSSPGKATSPLGPATEVEGSADRTGQSENQDPKADILGGVELYLSRLNPTSRIEIRTERLRSCQEQAGMALVDGEIEEAGTEGLSGRGDSAEDHAALWGGEQPAHEPELTRSTGKSADLEPAVQPTPLVPGGATVQFASADSSRPTSEIGNSGHDDASEVRRGLSFIRTRPVPSATLPLGQSGSAPAEPSCLEAGMQPAGIGGAVSAENSAGAARGRPIAVARISGATNPEERTALARSTAAEPGNEVESSEALRVASRLAGRPVHEWPAGFRNSEVGIASPDSDPGSAKSDTGLPVAGLMREARGREVASMLQTEATAPKGAGAPAVQRFASELTSRSSSEGISLGSDWDGIASAPQSLGAESTSLGEQPRSVVPQGSAELLAGEMEASIPLGSLATRRVARSNARVVENIAAPLAIRGSGAVADTQVSPRKTETIGVKSVEGAKRSVGTDTAYLHRTMPATLELPPTASAASALARLEFGQSDTASIDFAVATAEEFSPVVPATAHEAVAAVMIAAERVIPGERSAVSLHFSVGEADLLVRVEMRQEQVHATFHTDSTELQAALTEECRSSALAAAGHTIHFAPSAGSSGTSPEARDSFTGAGNSFSRQEDGQQRRSSAGEPDAFPRGHRGSAAASGAVETVGPAQRIRVSPTSVHLHTLA